jgi:hypothetical protein
VQTAQRERDSGLSTQAVPAQACDPLRSVADILGDPAGRRLTVRARWYWFTSPDETA